MRIGIVAASSRYDIETAHKAVDGIKALYPDGRVSVFVHPESFLKSGHFAGDDAARARAFLDVANDPEIDALWFARGGYGACRIAEQVVAGLTPAARKKTYLGYSDAGSILAALYRLGFPHVFHGPMTGDVNREDPSAFKRAVRWLVERDKASLEPSVLGGGRPTAAFNLTILSALMGTALEPDLTGHVLMLEEVSEALYRIDRMMFHVTSQPAIRRVAGIRLGYCTDIVGNDPEFEKSPEEIARDWCGRSGIPFLGAARIGHVADNHVVPFGRLQL